MVTLGSHAARCVLTPLDSDWQVVLRVSHRSQGPGYRRVAVPEPDAETWSSGTDVHTSLSQHDMTSVRQNFIKSISRANTDCSRAVRNRHLYNSAGVIQ